MFVHKSPFASPEPGRGKSLGPWWLAGEITQVQRDIPYPGIGFHGHSDFIRATGNDVPTVDRYILARMRLEKFG
jgi:hypothetical protein